MARQVIASVRASCGPVRPTPNDELAACFVASTLQPAHGVRLIPASLSASFRRVQQRVPVMGSAPWPPPGRESRAPRHGLRAARLQSDPVLLVRRQSSSRQRGAYSYPIPGRKRCIAHQLTLCSAAAVLTGSSALHLRVATAAIPSRVAS